MTEIEERSKAAGIQALMNLDETIVLTIVGEDAVGTAECAEDGMLTFKAQVVETMPADGRTQKGYASYTRVCTKSCPGCQVIKHC